MNGDPRETVVLIGAESSGKSSIFRNLTGFAAGDEANFRGSTVTCRHGHAADCDCDVVDTPGLRWSGSTETTRLALAELTKTDRVLLVVRGTDLQAELESLLHELPLHGKRTAVAVTFADKAATDLDAVLEKYREILAVPVIALNARDLQPSQRESLIAAIHEAQPRSPQSVDLSAPQPQSIVAPVSVFEHHSLGPVLSLLLIFAMYAVPVGLAYQISSWLQPLAEVALIEPMKNALVWLPAWAAALTTGSYGLLTLGWYSFLWAFPVVLLIGFSTALSEESGIHDRITRALDPWLRRVGLDGRDLLPVLTGYGCNVVAVMQSRACASCTRKSCVSMISFGSACSYQMGATLAVFGAAGRPGFFVPYLFALFLAGAAHTRIWHGKRQAFPLPRAAERAFFQRPRWRSIGWRIQSVLKQFLTQAMPIFLIICVVSALLEMAGVLAWLGRLAAPAMALFHLPGDAAAGLILSLLRKDGILILTQGGGSLVAAMSGMSLVTLVWLASTFSACLVTLWTVRREMGWSTAGRIFARQALTSTAVALILSSVGALSN